MSISNKVVILQTLKKVHASEHLIYRTWNKAGWLIIN